MPSENINALPRKSKKATRFSVMVAGEAGLGKTTLLATLFDGHILPPSDQSVNGNGSHVFNSTTDIVEYQFELEVEPGVRLLVDAIDTPGYSDTTPPNFQAIKLLKHIESIYSAFFEEEQRVIRNPKSEEKRIHVLLYLIEPTGLGLKQFDINFMKILANRVNIIPVIAKADGLTKDEIEKFKRQLSEDMARNDIKIFDFSNSTEMEAEEIEKVKSMLPLTVVGSTFPHPADKPRGRAYPWGFVNCDDEKVCDLWFLKNLILQNAREDLKDYTQMVLYEHYRTELLSKNGELQSI